MSRPLYIAFKILLLSLLFCQPLIAQPGKLSKAPTDKFSKAFLKIYQEAPTQFIKVKTKKTKAGAPNNYILKKLLPGSKAGFLVKGDTSFCIYNFGTFDGLENAEEAMTQLSKQIKYSLLLKSIVRYKDSSVDRSFVKRTAIAEMKDGGFYGFNINVDVVRKDEDPADRYSLQLKISGGKGTLYRFIYKHEPIRSPLFLQTFRKMYTQFNGMENYTCNELLPGFECTLVDSAGVNELIMEKRVADFPDARVEFESLTSNLRAILGDRYVYYIPQPGNKIEREVVFIQADDHDKVNRKSLSTYLVKKAEYGYAVRVIMYRP
ncbi:MAG: hypothetical protein JWQ40_585 [Segetibacter sp.]|nr:hypothetical protein [Segetibacter sp.]